MPEKEKTALLDAYKQRKAVMQKAYYEAHKAEISAKGRLTIWHTRIRSQHIAQLTKTR